MIRRLAFTTGAATVIPAHASRHDHVRPSARTSAIGCVKANKNPHWWPENSPRWGAVVGQRRRPAREARRERSWSPAARLWRGAGSLFGPFGVLRVENRRVVRRSAAVSGIGATDPLAVLGRFMRV